MIASHKILFKITQWVQSMAVYLFQVSYVLYRVSLEVFCRQIDSCPLLSFQCLILGPSNEMAIDLLKEVLTSHHHLLPSIIPPIKLSLEAARSDVSHFTLISNVCHKLSPCLSEFFTELFILEMLTGVDESHLVKVCIILVTVFTKWHGKKMIRALVGTMLFCLFIYLFSSW